MNILLHIFRGLVIVLLATATTTSVAAKSGVFELLQNDDIPTLTLRTDLVVLLEESKTDAAHPAVLSWETRTGQAEEWPLKISARGKYRRRVCDFPPLRLKFDRDDLERRHLNRHNKLKLVTHCLDDRAEGQTNLLREYLAYQLYQAITPYSYRVQLVKIHYVDENRRVNGFRRYAFLIEDTDDMAERIGGEECDACMNPSPQVLDRRAENLHALFQFMIGNTDYSLPMVRNMKLVTMADGRLVPVGYDFDFAGLVNAAYALPASELGQVHVRQRIFLGMYVEDSIMQENIALLRRQRQHLEAVIDDCKLLLTEERDDMLYFLNGFYTELDRVGQQGGNLFLALKETHPQAMPAGGAHEHYQIGR